MPNVFQHYDLLEDVMVILRVSDQVYEDEVIMLIEAAIADMKRVGINEKLFKPLSLDPQVKMAIACYCKAHFGFDNPEAERLDAAYRTKVTDLLHSSANIAAGD